jgi:hypothetical protein
MESKRRPIFMTDSTVIALKNYFNKNSSISYEELKSGFLITPEQINSLVLDNYLKRVGVNKNKRYSPGLKWETTGVFYRYGSRVKQVDSSKILNNILTLSHRTKEDFERAYLFRIGDIVSYSWGNAPAGLGVVVDVQPVNRKVTVRWPYGTHQEHVDTLTLIPRDSGDRQLSQPLLDKDILGKTPEYFDPIMYSEGREDNNSYLGLSKPSFNSSNKIKASQDKLRVIAKSLVPGNVTFSDKLNQDYILAQAEIVVSVNTEKDNPLYKDTPWYITPETAKNVNDNGDAWTSGVLINAYKTFRGAYNFYEHEQKVEASKGRVVDAVLREVPLGNGKSYFATEILVATNKKHKKLANRIEAGSIKTLSMGCTCTYTQCSQCGNVSFNPENKCIHLKYNKGGTFLDQHGVRRVVAELCGGEAHPDSVEFEEASWVEVPAWRNATVHNIINKATNMANVVGYLHTRLYGKDSFEIMLEDGKFKDIKLKFRKTATDDFFEEMPEEEVPEETEEKVEEPQDLEFTEEENLDLKPSTGKELLEENLITSSE